MKTLTFCSAALLVLAAACSKTPEISIESVSVTPEKVELTKTGTQQLELTVLPENAAYGTPEWTIDNEEVATVDASGIVTAVAPGTANITVTVNGVEAAVPVTVYSGNKLAADAAVGDFYLADGSLLDKETAEDEVKSAQVIGLVFTTDVERMGEAEKAALQEKGIEPHGLVLATATNGLYNYYYWYYFNGSWTRDESEIGFNKLCDTDEEIEGKEKETYATLNADVNGYAYTQAIFNERTEDLNADPTAYGVFQAVSDFETIVPAPANSTGWYLPSVGQWFDALRGLGGIILNDSDSFLADTYGNFSWSNKGRINDALNETMAKVADDQKVEYAVDYNQDQFWTSSICSDTKTWAIMFDNASFVYCWAYNKFWQYSVRTVLGF